MVAVSIFSSNILFWLESGYFDTASELKPLLHTWSLAVEEQYYIIFPLFMIVTWRLGLIWIDGAHGYPVVSMDVINSYRLCNQNGFVLIDDVWIDPEESDQYYKSIGGFESLSSLKDANLIKDFTLFNKRLGGQYNTPWEKKFVGLFRKQ